MARTFRTAVAFKASLEMRLKELSESRGVPLHTVRLKVVIDRLLARLFRAPEPPWLLKGGYAMELRCRPRARTTKDVDLSVGVDLVAGQEAFANSFWERLQDAVEGDPGDFFTFRIGAPQRELAGAPLGGARYPCEAVLAGKPYTRFHIDVGAGDAVVDAPEPLEGEDVLGFAGIGPVRALAISRAQQFAEKVHAYTFPWEGREDTRTKDLVDLVLLIETGLNPERLRPALTATFRTRGTHALPAGLPNPPELWRAAFAAMSAEARLSTADHREGFAIVDRFWVRNGLGIG